MGEWFMTTSRDELAQALADALEWDWSAEPHVPSAVDCCRDVVDRLIESGAIRFVIEAVGE